MMAQKNKDKEILETVNGIERKLKLIGMWNIQNEEMFVRSYYMKLNQMM